MKMRIMKAVGLNHNIKNCRLRGNKTRYDTIQYVTQYDTTLLSVFHWDIDSSIQETHKLDIEMTQTYKSTAATAVTIWQIT